MDNTKKNLIKENIYMAKLSEQTERFDDMVDYMKNVIDLTEIIEEEHITLLSIGYKNYIGMRRTAWRDISSEEVKSKNKV